MTSKIAQNVNTPQAWEIAFYTIRYQGAEAI